MRMIERQAFRPDALRQQALLMAWFSPAFPIGGFAFSHGLEWAQEAGRVTGREGLERWIADLIGHGSARADAILLAEAWRAAAAGDAARLAAAVELGAALQPSRERALEAQVQGAAFLAMVEAAYARPAPAIDAARITLPVAAGLCGARHGVALVPLAAAYSGGFVANLVSAAVRLGVVGQTDGQRVIAAMHPAVAALAVAAEGLTLDDLGGAALVSDLTSMQHETQYSRLFRS